MLNPPLKKRKKRRGFASGFPFHRKKKGIFVVGPTRRLPSRARGRVHPDLLHDPQQLPHLRGGVGPGEAGLLQDAEGHLAVVKTVLGSRFGWDW